MQRSNWIPTVNAVESLKKVQKFIENSEKSCNDFCSFMIKDMMGNCSLREQNYVLNKVREDYKVEVDHTYGFDDKEVWKIYFSKEE